MSLDAYSSKSASSICIQIVVFCIHYILAASFHPGVIETNPSLDGTLGGGPIPWDNQAFI